MNNISLLCVVCMCCVCGVCVCGVCGVCGVCVCEQLKENKFSQRKGSQRSYNMKELNKQKENVIVPSFST